MSAMRSLPREETDAHPLGFPVVGVGASAGGLESIRDLIGEIPAGTNLALLVVMHLDPSRPSQLTEILERSTAIKAVVAEHDQPIQPGYIYVIPPNASMAVSQGRIRLMPRGEITGPPMPVDTLLDSLAADQRSNAVGVVLSGSGSDGALGLQALKECGGTTFAQDERSALFASMPRAAISLGCVDAALTPAEIGKELVRLARHPYLQAADEQEAPSALLSDEGLQSILKHLKSICTIDFSHYKRGTIERRIARRIALRDLDSDAAYLSVLQSEPTETHALCTDLLIKYTRFFRDPEVFEALAEAVLPRLFKSTVDDGPLRVWVAGCSTGEEVYSIGIVLTEYLEKVGRPKQFQIFGTDISDAALETARNGRYIETVERDVSPERLSRFFQQEGNGYRIVKSLRECCTFARQNVVYDPPFARMHLVSCRNLLIYMDASLQRRVLPSFHFALLSDGVLMLGASESVGSFAEVFAPIEASRGRFFVKKPLVGRPPAIVIPLRPPSGGSAVTVLTPERRTEAATALPAIRKEASAADQLHAEFDRLVLDRYAPGCVMCDDDLNIVEFRGDTSLFISNPAGPPTRQLRRLVRPEVFVAIDGALKAVRKDGFPVRRDGIQMVVDGHRRDVGLEVVPIQVPGLEGCWYVVAFQQRVASDKDNIRRSAAQAVPILRSLAKRLARSATIEPADDNAAEIERLNRELHATREQIRLMLEEHEGAVEELRALEEEALASNEEYQSTNEELEAAKEEQQAINEELATTNDELRYRNRELKALHDEIVQSRDYADAVLETMAEPLLVLDQNLRVSRANRAFYDAFKTTPRDTLHCELYALGSHQWDVPALRVLLEDLLPKQTQVNDFEVTADLPGVGRRSLRLNARRVAWPEHAFILMTFEDVTERDLALRQLVESAKQKDEFLAMLAHELRNPLASISNALQIWKLPNATEKMLKDAQHILERQLHQQVRLVDDLLDVSRITRGLVAVSAELVDLAVSVRHAHEALQGVVAEHRHQVTLSLPDEKVVVQGDPARLEQIVSNLLGNAIKYTPDGGRICIALERDEDHAVLTVADNGIGMSADFLEQAFGIFVQAERTLDRAHGGLGMGLALVRRLVELHGGTVRAQSAGLSHGSTLIVRLPCLQSESPVSKTARAPGPELPTRLLRMLIVDDNDDARTTMVALLEIYGHQVAAARDGPTALEKLDESDFDAVLLDIGLPGMDGYEVCRRIRQRSSLRQPIVVALSGYAGPSNVARAMEAGFDAHLPKPATPDQIAEAFWRHEHQKR
jgi:two-component system CheB/CheR fusion protein